MFATPSLVLLLVSVAPVIHGHTVHLGGDCANVQPMQNFNMDKVSYATCYLQLRSFIKMSKDRTEQRMAIRQYVMNRNLHSS